MLFEKLGGGGFRNRVHRAGAVNDDRRGYGLGRARGHPARQVKKHRVEAAAGKHGRQR
jgi:hypothetical protein